jgi:hypothetical protein
MRTTMRPPTRRTVALIAIAAIVGGLLLGAVVRLIAGSPVSSPIAVLPSASPTATSGAVSPKSSATPPTAATPSEPAGPTPSTPSQPGASAGATTATTLPVKGSGREVGTGIRMAPGTDGSLYVSIPKRGGDVVALLGSNGKPRAGWPILLPGVEACDMLFPLRDGSVRVVCSVTPLDDGLDSITRRAFAFAANGRAIHGWPVDTDETLAGRMVGDSLWLMVEPYAGDVPQTPESGSMYMLEVHADGSLDQGRSAAHAFGDDTWAIGPDGIGYHTRHYDWSATDLAGVTSEVTAFDLTGRRAGWPLTIDGNASALAFDVTGLVHLVVGSPVASPTRTMVLDKDGHLLPNGADDLSIVSSSPWDGAGAEFPAPPVVADDGTAFIVDTEGAGTTIIGLDPAGASLAGWPFRSSTDIGWTGFCDSDTTGCGHVRSDPAVGPQDLLYVILAPASPSTGGSLVAVTATGHVQVGWPVRLNRAGSMFWSLAAGRDGGVWALAIEPESGGASATVLAIADDSTVLWSSTIVQP